MRSSKTTTVVQPSEYDIVLGRKGSQHPGNRFYRQLIQTWRDMYRHTACNTDKNHLIEKNILDPVISRGGRFLRYHDREGSYKVLDEAECYVVVKQALRDSWRLQLKAAEAEDDTTNTPQDDDGVMVVLDEINRGVQRLYQEARARRERVEALEERVAKVDDSIYEV